MIYHMNEERSLWPALAVLIVQIGQFFICFKTASHLDRQYTVFGKVIEGMEFIDLIKRGSGSNGQVSSPDKIISLTAKK